MSLVHNERTKLLATALNNAAVATIVTAFVAPAVGLRPGAAADPWWLVIGTAWFVAGAGLHLLARAVLGRLRE